MLGFTIGLVGANPFVTNLSNQVRILPLRRQSDRPVDVREIPTCRTYLDLSLDVKSPNLSVSLLSSQCRSLRLVSAPSCPEAISTSPGMFCIRICTLYRHKQKTRTAILASFYLSVLIQAITGVIILWKLTRVYNLI